MKKDLSSEWNRILSMIEASIFNINHGKYLTFEEKSEILKERAAKLAEVKSDLVEAYEDLLIFNLGLEQYGIGIEYLKEIYFLREITPLPGTPNFIAGIVNIRGEIISIVDIKKLFNLPGRGLTNLNRLIILRNEKTEFGILADSVEGIKRIKRTTVKKTLPIFSESFSEYVNGISDEGVIIIDGYKVVNNPEINMEF